MRPEITTKIGGKSVRLYLPIGGLERIAEVNPQLGEVATCIAMGAWKLEELRAVVSAGLEYGESGVSFDEAYEAVGLRRLGEIAAELLVVAFGPVEKKPDPVAEPEPGAPSE